MKKIFIFIILLSVINYCQGQDRDYGRGLSFSYSTNNAWGVDMFARASKNRFHLGYGHQFNGQEIKVVKRQKETNDLTEIGNGEYFWVIDLGFSRIFIDRITIHSELSIGGNNEFTSFRADRTYYKDYSLVTDPKSALGIGLKVGYLMNSGIEPFIAIHTLKKLDFGVRLSW